MKQLSPPDVCLRAAIAVAVMAVGAPLATAQTADDSRYVPEGYVKVFADEMDGRDLNTSRWWTRYTYEDGMLDTLNDERQRYRESNNHVVRDGMLQLTARLAAEPQPPRFLYESGMIRSKLTFKYGYFETRVRMPAGRGVWPAFWLNSDSDADGKAAWPPEIDIFEFVNNGKEDTDRMLHMGVVVKKHRNEGPNPWGGRILQKHDAVRPRGAPGSLGGAIYHAPHPIPDDFHTIACLWDTDDTVSIVVDGELMVKFDYKWVYQDGRDAPYAHVLLNLGIGGGWAGRHGIDDHAMPLALAIDYVRVYQKAGHKRVGRSTIGRDLLARTSGPTPFPDPQDDLAWPGHGPVRVFPWMVDNRAFFWSRREQDQRAIVVIGDSLAGNWKPASLMSAFPNARVANRGIGGDVSRGVLFRLKEDALDLNPARLVLMIGTNDLSAHAAPEVVAGNIAAIVEQARRYHADLPIVLCTLPPRHSPKAPTRPGAVEDLNARIRRLADALPNVALVDVHAALADPGGQPVPEYFEADLLHLSPAGYEQWARLLEAVR